MPRSISVTTSQEIQTRAAENVSKLLSALGYRHAFIGGFAWSLLGSRRLTQISVWSICHPMLKSNLVSFGGHDIDILIEKKPGIEFDVLRRQITELDKRFAQAGVQFYFVQVCLFLPNLFPFNSGFSSSGLRIESHSHGRGTRVQQHRQRARRDSAYRFSWASRNHRTYICNSRIHKW